MSNYSSVDKVMVNLRRNTKWDLEFIESYRAFISKNYDLENIFAIFSYHPLLSERAANEKDWNSFKNYIASDFKNLKYPPCHLYVYHDEVHAIWFIPHELLISELGEEDKKLIEENMLSQLGELKLCDLKELNLSEGERDISEELYLEEYYRKNQFLKILLSKEMDNSIIDSAKENS
ncbi:hypothetical protein G4D61_01130 [Bacillus ginsengihumi]|uniref:Uncharacterized protein n=1 Tax=Heyndrickxia ginsengihumi TaxID=363870 RepID=A0A6M0P1R2_9BACI|nr:hypothetical protein [Heyndrickxia ginsengihumi]NEY18572.1 hypothetical protein [Heyndrickxia ginsengihumi]